MGLPTTTEVADSFVSKVKRLVLARRPGRITGTQNAATEGRLDIAGWNSVGVHK